VVYEILKSLLALKTCLRGMNFLIKDNSTRVLNHSRATEVFLKYRRLEILNRIFNSLSHIFFSEIICFVALESISLAFTMIKLHEEFPVVGILIGSLYFFTAFLVITYVLGLCGSIKYKSCRVLSCVTDIARMLRTTSDLKAIKSCLPLNVKLGCATDISRKTPVYYLHFIFEQTVNLVLLNN